MTIDFGTTEYKVRHGFLNISEYSNLSEELFCRSCSCSATVRTSDKLYVMVELAGKSMDTNSTDLVGGIMKTDLEVHTGNDVFNSFFKELKEEIGVVEDDINEAYLQTIFLEHSTNVCFYFEVTLKINSEELLLRFKNNNEIMI